MSNSLGTRFTSDVESTTPVKCARTRCSVILNPGDERHVVHNNVPGNAANVHKGSRIVCPACFAHYGGTALRSNATVMDSERREGQGRFDHDAIRGSVRAASKKSRVIPCRLDLSCLTTGTESAPSSRAVTHLPNVVVPSNWSSSRHPVATAYGYTQNHLSHGQEQARWASRAYAGDNEDVAVIFSLQRPNEGKMGWTVVNVIYFPLHRILFHCTNIFI